MRTFFVHLFYCLFSFHMISIVIYDKQRCRQNVHLNFRFNSLFKKRYLSIHEEYERTTSALQNVSEAAELAGQRLMQLEHEKIVLEQKKEVLASRHCMLSLNLNYQSS